jgi:uncharacterized cupredoxin-like copper-binding protein
MPKTQQRLRSAFIAAVCALAAPAYAHGDASTHAAGPVKKEQKPWGIAGDAKAVSRTVRITMLDTMRFSPDRVEVKLGETVRFAHRNAGQQLHEFVIGTREENDAHAALMVKFPGMEHAEPYMAHVAAGKAGEIVWRFNRPGEFMYACLIAGHYQAGMLGTIVVAAAAPRNVKQGATP